MKLTIKVKKGRKEIVKKLLAFLDVKGEECWDLDIDKYCIDVEVPDKDRKALSDLVKEINF